MDEKTLDVEMTKKDFEIILNWWTRYEVEHVSTESERELSHIFKYALQVIDEE